MKLDAFFDHTARNGARHATTGNWLHRSFLQQPLYTITAREERAQDKRGKNS